MMGCARPRSCPASLSRPAIYLLLITAGCLDPAVESTDFERRFGDPKLDANDAPHVEDNPLLTKNVNLFSKKVDYLNGFAEGEVIHYWNVEGATATFIAPMFQLISGDEPIGRPIIDVLPGDTGYTPWWREVHVRVTAAYRGEHIWSRDAIDAGLALGILELPEEQANVKNCPVVLRTVRIPVDDDQTVEPGWGWYRNQRVSFVEFSDRLPLPPDVREMPSEPVYVLQRINEAEPLSEYLAGVDLNHDGDLLDTNNIFPAKPGNAGYSPLWYFAFVRTVADYPSIDTNPAAVGLSAKQQFLSAAGAIISDLVVPGGLDPRPDFLVNCSIQRVRGEL